MLQKAFWFSWNKQMKRKQPRCFPHYRSHVRKREARGPNTREPGGRPVCHSLATWGQARSFFSQRLGFFPGPMSIFMVIIPPVSL